MAGLHHSHLWRSNRRGGGGLAGAATFAPKGTELSSPTSFTPLEFAAANWVWFDSMSHHQVISTGFLVALERRDFARVVELTLQAERQRKIVAHALVVVAADPASVNSLCCP